MLYDKRDLYLFIYTLILIFFSYIYIDRYLAHFFCYIKDGIFKEFFSFITNFGRSEWYLIPSILLYWYFKSRNRENAKIAIYIFLVNIISGVIVVIMKVLFGRARPNLFLKDNLYGFNWFEFNYNLTSFPSGHTITAISSMFAISFLFPKYRYFFILFGLLVACSRVVGCNHFLSDVILSIYLGYLISNVLYKRIFKKW